MVHRRASTCSETYFNPRILIQSREAGGGEHFKELSQNRYLYPLPLSSTNRTLPALQRPPSCSLQARNSPFLTKVTVILNVILIMSLLIFSFLYPMHKQTESTILFLKFLFIKKS
jgi:hypothetical protein